MLFSTIYHNLCESRKPNIVNYKRFSGLHEHHIIPKHLGGSNDSTNLTYLTVREHIIAHFLLWKIYKSPNDLRAMKMLGANLSPHHRRMIGEYCRDNSIGFHSDKFTREDRKEWALRGIETQKQSNRKDTFYYWSTKEGRAERASMGGIIGGAATVKNKIGIHIDNPELKHQWASMGAKSHTGKKQMYRIGDTTFIRVSPEDIDQKLNDGYIFGSPYKHNLGKKMGASPKRKKVTDGVTIYDCSGDAAQIYNVSPSSIINWCKSPKIPNWQYVN